MPATDVPVLYPRMNGVTLGNIIESDIRSTIETMIKSKNTRARQIGILLHRE
jgi:hypothetical protein